MPRKVVSNYKKIKKACSIIINDLSDAVIKTKKINQKGNIWKGKNRVLENLTKLTLVLMRLENIKHPEDDQQEVENISPNDYLILESFMKKYKEGNELGKNSAD